MDLEQNPASASPRSPIAPPQGRLTGAQVIFWNEREFRPGWRLLVYLLLFALIALAGVFLTIALHLPQVSGSNLTAAAMLSQESVALFAALGAAAIMGLLEGRPFGVYGL